MPDNQSYRENAISRLKWKAKYMRETSRKIEKLVEFLEHWEEINGKLDPEIEEILYEISSRRFDV